VADNNGNNKGKVIQYAEDVKEKITTQVILILIPGLLMLMAGILMTFVYPGSLGAGLGWVLLLAGIGLTGFGFHTMFKAKGVTEYRLDCPFCGATNVLTDQPDGDIRCTDCQRMVPILNGLVLRVFQVRCGYCQHLNYYSEKSSILICENCDSEIPIAADVEAPAASVIHQYARQEDTNLYDLVLLETDNRTEKLIGCLQAMLALNRNQIKKILEAAPATLYREIPKKKAELLLRDIEAAGGRATYQLSEQNAPEKR
jgi:ribosomal protein S27E